jgi:hypothetical protein
LEIVAPDLSDPDSDPTVVAAFSSGDATMLKQCRNYNVSILPILNTIDADGDVDVNVVPFRTSVFFFNEPASPDDLAVVKKSAREVDIEWTHFPLCYEGYHITLTRFGDEKVVFAAETRFSILSNYSFLPFSPTDRVGWI